MSVRFPRVCCPLTVRYGEGVFIGYRWYDARHLPVMFPFGHGLSYATFGYDSPRLSASTLAAGDPIAVMVNVTNTGDRAGSEVVQVYVRDVDASVLRPDKELAGFGRVTLELGETRSVEITIDPGAFAFWCVLRFPRWWLGHGARPLRGPGGFVRD